MTTRRAVATTLAVTAGMLAATPAFAVATPPTPDLLADANRDGRIGPDDDGREDTWTRERGAIFLPNLDDDARRCRVRPSDLDRPSLDIDRRLAACYDAADDRVNGARDARDLARMRIRPLPALTDAAVGRIRVDRAGGRHVRVFVRRDGAFRPRSRLSASQLRSGVELGLEGRDIVRNPARWDGKVTVSVAVADGHRRGEDRVQLRVAPLLLQNDLQPATTVFAARPRPGSGWPQGDFFGSNPPGVPGEWAPFADSLQRAARAAGLPAGATRFTTGIAGWWSDMWWQDIFEPASASMPGQSMRVAIRSASWSFRAPAGGAGGRCGSLAGCSSGSCAGRTWP